MTKRMEQPREKEFENEAEPYPEDLIASPANVDDAQRNAQQLRRRGRARDIPYTVRDERALALRTAGATFKAITTECGYPSTASAAAGIRRAVAHLPDLARNAMRKIESERLDRAMLAVWPRVTAGDSEAIMTMLAIMRRRTALFGLDQRVTPDIGDLVRQLAAQWGSARNLDPAEAVAIANEVIRDAARH